VEELRHSHFLAEKVLGVFGRSVSLSVAVEKTLIEGL
jgi:hypothetical protein